MTEHDVRGANSIFLGGFMGDEGLVEVFSDSPVETRTELRRIQALVQERLYESRLEIALLEAGWRAEDRSHRLARLSWVTPFCVCMGAISVGAVASALIVFIEAMWG